MCKNCIDAVTNVSKDDVDEVRRGRWSMRSGQIENAPPRMLKRGFKSNGRAARKHNVEWRFGTDACRLWLV